MSNLWPTCTGLSSGVKCIMRNACCFQAQRETQNAALRYERACGQLVAAKEMVNLAEQGFFRKEGQPFDPAWQEMLNHATMKVGNFYL